MSVTAKEIPRASDRQPDSWPPTGHQFVHELKLQIGDNVLIDAELSLPDGDGAVALAESRVARMGGDCAADLEFRAELHRAIGRVTVASGHVEAAMMRVIRVADFDGARFGRLTRDNWSALVKRLERLGSSTHPLASQLTDLLDWAREKHLKETRDNVVHGYWWHWAGVGVTSSRFMRDGTARFVVSDRDGVAGLDEVASLLFAFADDLDALVQARWPQVRLSSPFQQ